MKDFVAGGLRIVMFVALFVLVATLVAGEAHPLEQGSAAPPILGATLEGKELKAVVKGERPTVVNVWATWCPPCLAELPAFVDASRRYAGRVDFVGLAAESPVADVKRLMERFDVSYPVFLVVPETQRRWNATALPSTYIVGGDGRVLWSIRGQIDAETLADKLEETAGIPRS